MDVVSNRAPVENADYGDAEDAGFSVDFANIWAALYRSRFWILGILIGTLLIGVVVTLLSTPIYRADSTVQIDQEAAKVLGTEDTNATAAIQDSDRFLNTQLDVIRSRSLAQAVAEDLKLLNNPKFLETMDVEPDDTPPSGLTLQQAQREQVLKVLGDNLHINLPIDSRIVTVSFDSPDPALAARVANSFAQNYIRNNLQRKFDTSSYARDFLKQQLDEAAVRLAQSERDSLEYAKRTRIIDVSNAANPAGDSSPAPKSLIAATLVKLNIDHANAVARRIDAQKKWEIARGQNVLALHEVLDNLAIQNLLQQRATVEASYEEELRKRKEDYPTVRQMKARLDELNSQIGVIASSIRQTLKNEYDATLQAERALKTQIAELQSETLNEQGQSVQLGILQRKTNNDRQLYDLLLKRYNELNAEAGVQANNVSIVDRADTPLKPIKPSIPLNMALSLLAGIGIAGLFVFGREQLFNVIRTPEDVTRKLGLTSLGAVPLVQDGVMVQREILDPKTQVSETFSTLRSSLMLISAHGLPHSLMFTSAMQGEGKSSCCFSTAVALSRIGKRVLIIDLDLRRPNQHNMFGVKNGAGMSDLLSHNKTAAEVIQQSSVEGVWFVPGGAIPPNPAELLASPSTREVLEDLQAGFDVMLIDSPPLLGLADAVEISSMVEACIFVMEAGRNQASHARGSIQRLMQAGANVAGVLLTKFDVRAAGFGYEYAYQYSYEYGPEPGATTTR